MTDTMNPYNPVIERPPTKPSMRTRKTSRDKMQNNLNILTSQRKRQMNDTHETVVRQSMNDQLCGNTLTIEAASRERSLSWGNLQAPSLHDNQRSLSASNMHALADPALSIKAAISKKPYDKPHTSFSREKAVFTAWAQKYYHQLTIGCGDVTCKNIFCKSSSRKKNFDSQMAALISIELAGYKNHYLCVKDKKKQSAKVLDSNIFKQDGNSETLSQSSKEFGKVPFLYTFYSMSPFRSLFLPCPLTPSGLGLHKTHSHSDLHTPTKVRVDNEAGSTITSAMKSHLDSLTNTISSSFSNIFKMVSTEPSPTESLNEEKKAVCTESVFQFNNKDNEVNSCEDKNKEIPDDIKENRIMTRKRIPSVRIFGSEYAVDTELGVQDNIDDFESKVAEEFRQNSIDETTLFGGDDEVEQEEINDEHATDGFSLTHLTLGMFGNVVANYVECKDETFLLNTLRTVFSSWDALNMSFQDEDFTTNHPFDVKIPDVIEVFKMLDKLENGDKFKAVLTDTIQVMLLKKHCISEPSELTPFVVILAMPYLFDYAQVVYELANAISSLPTKCLQVLAWFIAERFTEAQLRFLVLGIKSQIKSESSWNSPSLRNNQLVVSLCKTMNLLYNANNYHGNHQPILPNSTFYCDDLTMKIDFKQAYSFWKRMLTSRQSTSNSILNYPFLLEPAVKVQVIHIDAITQMREEYQDAIVHQARVQQVQKSWSDFNDSSKISQEVRSAMCPYLLLEIRRENLIEDTLKQLQEKSSDLKKPLKIKYTSGGEQGLDMGGLQKEFFQVIVETVFDSSYGLFNQSEDGHAVWFNTFSFESNVMFELIGILLGLAIYNGIILDIHFPLLVYKKLLGCKVGLDDLYEIQPTLASGFSQLLKYTGDVENDFLQTFEVSHNVYGKTIEIELIPNGKDVAVTNDNRQHFVDLYVDSILNKSVENQFEAFKKGFYQVCNGPTIKLFTPPELELLVCGNPDLDFKALENVTEYRDGYTRSHCLMIHFWKIVHRFTFQQKQALLMFVTGSYRVPLKGLGAMSFYVQRNGPDSNNLPTSMTCFNRLLLPEYKSADKLERMLLLAIENSKGFGLT